MMSDQKRAARATRILIDRERRYKLFPGELFDEYAWNMMLHLFVRSIDNKATTDTRLCQLAKVPLLVGRRWIDLLVEDGQIEAHVEERDLVLTKTAVENLRAYLGE